ncbi:hypothetical protein COBT_001278 [Conglomerata obtusa]
MINTNKLDKNTYKYLTLPNDLQILLITNPDLDKSAIALSTRTGSYHDPIPGLSHFLEHMLFMGTKTYPKENEFMQFLSQHNGSTNAFTCEELTLYFLDIDPKYFSEGVSRFAGFFTEPLFIKDCVDRELKAVDSEFKKGLVSDAWRINRLRGVFSTVYDKFSCGNEETLKVDGIREKVVEHWKMNYCSGDMCLVVFHKDMEIENLIREEFSKVERRKNNNQKENILNINASTNKSFIGYGMNEKRCNILNTNEQNNYEMSTMHESCNSTNNNSFLQNIKVYNKHVFNNDFLNKYIFVESIKDTNELIIEIEVPKEFFIYKNNSLGFIKFQLEKENKNSLVDILKQNKYSYELHVTTESTLSYTLLVINVYLTKKGFNNIKSVLKIIKKYFDNFRHTQNDYMLLKEAERLNFLYKEQINSSDYVVNLVQEMQYYPIENLIDHDYIYNKYESNEIELLLNILRDNSNWLVLILSKDIESFLKDIDNTNLLINSNNNLKTDNKYNTNKNQEDRISKEMIRDGEIDQLVITDQINNNKKMKVVDLKIQKEYFYDIKYFVGGVIDFTEKIYEKNFENESMKLRFIYNNFYQVPKTILNIVLNTKIEKKFFLQYKIYLKLIDESFTEKYNDYLYYNLCSVSTGVSDLGIEININGLNDKISEVARKYINELKNISFDNFDLIKEKMRDYLIHKKQKSPYSRIFDQLRQKINPEALSIDECLCEINKMKKEDIKFIDKCFIELFVCGSGDYYIYENLINELRSEFKEDCQYRLINNNIEKEFLVTEDIKNNAVGIFIKCGTKNEFKNTAIFQILLQLSSEMFFDRLRTKEALGYVAINNITTLNDVDYMYFVVQSEKSCDFLEERINNFFNELKQEWDNLSEEEFETLRESAINNQNEDLNNLNEYFNFYNKLHFVGCCELNYKKIMICELEKLTKEDIILCGEKIIVRADKKIVM